MIDDNSVLGKIRSSYRAYKTSFEVCILRIDYGPRFILRDSYRFERIEIAEEFEEFKKVYPKNYKVYLADVLVDYEMLRDDATTVLAEFEDRRNTLGAVKFCRDIEFLIDRLKDMITSDDESHESFPESEKFTPTEKLLIWHYLHPNSLMFGYQYQLKPGIYLLSNLLGIKPESIKRPLLKLDEYTVKKNLTASQARGFCPTLEKVKSFLDESGLPEISKKVQERITELESISGKI